MHQPADNKPTKMAIQKSGDKSGPSRDASPSSLCVWAKECQRTGKYSDAEQYYSRAIAKMESLSSIPLEVMMEALKGRAQAREQLNLLDQALEDGNRMLKLDKTNPRGYICLGSTLEVKKKPKSALKCYAYGLTQCSNSHKSFDTLRKKQEALFKSLEELELNKKKRDPASILPIEVVIQIFSYLQLHQLLRCHRVSRLWRATATSDPSLYRHIDLRNGLPGYKGNRASVSSQSVKALVQYAANGVKSLKIDDTPGDTFSDNCYAYNTTIHSVRGYRNHGDIILGPLMQNLEEFEGALGSETKFHHQIFPPTSIRRLVVGDTISKDRLLAICSSAPNLEYIECRRVVSRDSFHVPRGPFPSVKVLRLAIEGSLNDNLTCFPNVEEFYLQVPAQSVSLIESLKLPDEWRNLNRLGICNTLRLHEIILPSDVTLLSLELRNLPSLRSWRVSSTFSAALEVLNIEYVGGIDSRDLRLFRGPRQHLTRLTLKSPQLQVTDLVAFLAGAAGLEYLNINSMANVTDSTLELLYPLKSLSYLDVGFCGEITGHGIINLIQNLGPRKGGNLRVIEIQGLEQIRRQTIDWARSVGVRLCY